MTVETGQKRRLPPGVTTTRRALPCEQLIGLHETRICGLPTRLRLNTRPICSGHAWGLA